MRFYFSDLRPYIRNKKLFSRIPSRGEAGGYHIMTDVAA
jgi:hypothetical protein